MRRMTTNNRKQEAQGSNLNESDQKKLENNEKINKHMKELPEPVKNIISFFLFVGIFYCAQVFSGMKSVYIKFSNKNRFFHF